MEEGEHERAGSTERSTELSPRLHAVWRSGAIGLWCETGLARPQSVAPAANPAAIGRGGAPDEVVEMLGRVRGVHKLPVVVPVGGRVRPATVPGVLLPLDSALELAVLAAGGGAPPPPWAGGGLVALSALSSGVRLLVRAGHVVPRLGIDGADTTVGWALSESPPVLAWRAAVAPCCHGLVPGPVDLAGLLDALCEHHVRGILAHLPFERRSDFGQALQTCGRPSSGGTGLDRAVEDFARAVAAQQVDVVLRVHEPDGREPVDGVREPGEILWRLEVLVRVGGDALQPVAELPDPSLVAGPVHAALDSARRTWTPLAQARTPATGVDLLVPTETIRLLVDEGAETLRRCGVEVLLPRAWTRVRTTVRMELAEAGSEIATTGRRLGLDQLADVRWELLVDGDPVDPAELDLMLARAGDLVRLRGRWVRADSQALRRAAKFLAERTGTRNTAADMLRALSSPEADGLEVHGPSAQRWAEVVRRGGPPVLPPWFTATLRPYQREGLEWLSGLADVGLGAVLADDMGLGKTVQVLALVSAEHGTPVAGPTLVVAPLSMLGTWRREAGRFAPRLRVLVHHGAGRVGGDGAAGELGSADLVLTTYGTVTRDVEALTAVPWRRVVADEAQTVKNTTTRAARALQRITAGQRVALTGTPVENRLSELRAILEFVAPGILPDASTFRARFAVPIETRHDDAAIARLHALTAPFLLRRLKSDPGVASDLPRKVSLRVDTPLSREQSTLYRAVVEDLLDQARDAKGASRRGVILAGLTALKQVCNHPAQYLSDGSGLFRGGRHRSGKVAALDRILDGVRASGERALVFTQYRAFGELLLPLLDRRAGTSVPFLHGGVSPVERTRMVERFQSEDGPPVMLASLKAGGTGLTLTAASHVVHLDRWWNPAVEAQATDRVHRIGQTNTVRVHTLVCPGTIEERIDELMSAKSELADLTLGPLVGRITELDHRALSELLRLDEELVDGTGP